MKTYLVGGAVRDQLLGLNVSERDWVVVGATPQEMQALGFRQVGRDFPVYLHPDTSEEYALARTERKTGSGHTGFDCNSDPSVTLEEDLSRRDLTINAIAQDDNGELIDPYGGREDLDARCMRHVSDAFVEDPLRVLRVARFAARFTNLGFSIAPETLDLMRAICSSGELASLPSERIWKELERALGYPEPAAFLQTLQDCDAWPWLLPELQDKTATLATLTEVSERNSDPEVRFAALFAALDSTTAKQLCERLHAPRRFRDLALLCASHYPQIEDVRSLKPALLLSFLQQLDALRRPERLEQFLEACTALQPTLAAQAAFLRRAASACKDVDIQGLANSGLAGHEIGDRIRQERELRLATLDGE